MQIYIKDKEIIKKYKNLKINKCKMRVSNTRVSSEPTSSLQKEKQFLISLNPLREST